HYQRVRLSIAKVVYFTLSTICLILAFSNLWLGQMGLALALLLFSGMLAYLYRLGSNTRLAELDRYNLYFSALVMSLGIFGATVNGSLPLHLLPCFAIFFYCLLSVRQAFVAALVCIVVIFMVALQGEPGFTSTPQGQRLCISILFVWLCSHVAHCFFFKMSMEQQQLLVTQTNFLRTVNHELRTPLASLTSAVHLCQQRELPADLREDLGQIQSIAQQMTTLISGVLDLSRGENHLLVENGTVALRPLLQDIAQLFQPMANSKGLKLAVHVAEAVPEEVVSDRVRLVQILSNFVSNAIKYSSQGTVCINLSAATVNGDNMTDLRFSVVDEGAGLTAEQVNGLFKPYTRFHEDNLGQSSGLGLSIVKELAGLLGGQVGVESVLGKGCTFWFDLRTKVQVKPQKYACATLSKQVDQHATKHANRHVGPQWAGKRLLIVEDDPMLVKLICKLLTSRGANCKAVHGVQEAMALLGQEGQFDLILTDYHMDGLNGGDLASMVRALPNYKQIPVLALTGGILDSDVEYALRSGINEILPKPINPELLYSKIDSYLKASVAPSFE
ncbi:MAG: hybrid sensor histidine kinase/response regulator, partial [Limnobacter sp.]|nr:hybrid sensor histidine kinase/response regulator [Limnobacter sp.]